MLKTINPLLQPLLRMLTPYSESNFSDSLAEASFSVAGLLAFEIRERHDSRTFSIDLSLCANICFL